MNPFTESTVARPLAPNTPAASCRTKRRSLVRLTLGALGLATSLGGPPAAGLQATRVLLAGVGLLAGVVAPGAAHAVDVNSATQEQLLDVRGIGPKTAQIIIEERTRGGRYESFDDLSDRVKGIGPKKSATLQAAGLTLGGQKTGAISSVSQEAPGSSLLVRPNSGKRDTAASAPFQRPGKTGVVSSIVKKTP